MAEMFAYSIAERVLNDLASYAFQEVCSAWSVKSELNKLKDTLSTITVLLLDAEEKQTTDRRLIHWLGKLKDVCYDVANVLDEFDFEKFRMRLLLSNSNSIKGKVRVFFSRSNSVMFHFKMGHKIKRIRARLDKIAVEKIQFSLSERVGGQLITHSNSRETDSIVQASNIIGRDDDQEQIVSQLLNSTNEENLSVISIIGLGGLGKTTLAKLVYNDNRVVENFDMRMWVCVSDQFDIKRLVHDISSATKRSCDEGSLDIMKKGLQDALRDEKFLLVLDDVWDTKPMGVTLQKWVELETLFDAGASGSRVIVTTRSETAASIFNPIYVHFLEGLSNEDCISLFLKTAFKKGEAQQYPHLIKIGEDIVSKCGGVPLALCTLGSMLYLKRAVRDWIHVRDNDIWNLEQGDEDILPALKLSYDALPSHLKPCFAFCSLFPKDHVFNSLALVSMWMAQGFLKSSRENQEFEEIGLDYIRQFLSRSLFQLEHDSTISIEFKMHDLVHDLAISVGQVEYYSVINFRPSDISGKVRHISISTKSSVEASQVPEFLLQLSKLQTFIVPEIGSVICVMDKDFLKTCISRFKYVRALDLSGLNVEELPSSIGNLRHLRYLNLSFNYSLKKLPDCICKLLSLQSLELVNCGITELPQDIWNLINLRRLTLTTKQRYFPKGIRHLTLLQTLWLVDCVNLKSLGEEIEYLTGLRKLYLIDCRNLESLPPNMKHLKALDDLVISGCKKLDMRSGEGIQGLRSFSIIQSGWDALPHWLQDSAETLQILHIYGCWNLTILPRWFENLTLLNQLEIQCCYQLLGFPVGMHHLTALRELGIKGCPKLIKRCKREEGEDWSKIAHVSKVTLTDETDVEDATSENLTTASSAVDVDNEHFIK